MTVRAKVQLHKYETMMTTKYPTNERIETRTLHFSPVTSGSDENKSFFASTPGGTIQLSMTTPEAWGQFELNKSYYLDFTPAE
jgi:hypothetical protein